MSASGSPVRSRAPTLNTLSLPPPRSPLPPFSFPHLLPLFLPNQLLFHLLLLFVRLFLLLLLLHFLFFLPRCILWAPMPPSTTVVRPGSPTARPTMPSGRSAISRRSSAARPSPLSLSMARVVVLVLPAFRYHTPPHNPHPLIFPHPHQNFLHHHPRPYHHPLPPPPSLRF